MHAKGHIPLDGKPTKARFGFDQFQKSPSAKGVDDPTVNEIAFPDEFFVFGPKK